MEVDFCVIEDYLAIQVSYSIDDSTTYEREVGGMEKFLKAYKQSRWMIVPRDTERQITEDGITIDVIPVWKWLLQSHPSLISHLSFGDFSTKLGRF